MHISDNQNEDAATNDSNKCVFCCVEIKLILLLCSESIRNSFLMQFDQFAASDASDAIEFVIIVGPFLFPFSCIECDWFDFFVVFSSRFVHLVGWKQKLLCLQLENDDVFWYFGGFSPSKWASSRAFIQCIYTMQMLALYSQHNEGQPVKLFICFIRSFGVIFESVGNVVWQFSACKPKRSHCLNVTIFHANFYNYNFSKSISALICPAKLRYMPRANFDTSMSSKLPMKK